MLDHDVTGRVGLDSLIAPWIEIADDIPADDAALMVVSPLPIARHFTDARAQAESDAAR